MHPPDSLTAADVRALIAETCLLAGGGPVRSVVICDDLCAATEGLSELLRGMPGLVSVVCVQDGFALVDAYAADITDVVLIGVHRVSGLGNEAMGLLLGINPTAVIIVVGSVADAEPLAAAYTRGARALLVWEPGQDSQPDGPLVW